ncbi:MAG: diaminobutyrate--2-oxoglutarate transaminase [Acidobacteria bacterium]|nr:MAG: diaminobutyrate--2-oxoglutarate transaminase [Acidobacteriota bacterium]REK11524.1 MAG: diaminobutyrate--2-oxoglutarate transaminase [Acidobacteriota bacterium]
MTISTVDTDTRTHSESEPSTSHADTTASRTPEVFERYESEVRGYCRSFPAVFQRARGASLWDENGRRYIDFFAGAGALNYGHNDPRLKEALLDYLAADGVVHSLDFFTVAKQRFLETFQDVVLKPRGMGYKMQFPGPTGTNAVEAAIKLARKVTGRSKVMSFTNGFHGMTLGSLALTGSEASRKGAGVSLQDAVRMPFDGYLEGGDTIDFIATMLEDASSGVDLPAAAIVETIQAEGGVNVARFEWLRRLAEVLARHDVLLIVDDIQVGCGRTGPFFSFEEAGIEPDIVCLSKSLSGFGLPLALVLLRPELDVWKPGEHNGTFRGHNPAFVTATVALDFWRDDALSRRVAASAEKVEASFGRLAEQARDAGVQATSRGRGMIRGLELTSDLAASISAAAFERGLILETAGAEDQVLKFLAPLTIDEGELTEGLEILEHSAEAVLAAAPESADA